MQQKTSKGNILLVEDEEQLHQTLRLNLSLEGYEVTSAWNGNEALQKMEGEYFDLVVLDLMLPQVDGFTVLEAMRLKKITSAVLILSARNSFDDRIAGLKLGADDYLVKPFALEELMLRMEKLLAKNVKPGEDASGNTYTFNGHRVNFSAMEAVTRRGEKISLSKKENMLLQLLVQHAGEVVTRENILRSVWGYQVFPTTRTIDNFMLTLRRYFEDDPKQPRHFHSVRGMGYKFLP